MNLTDEQAEALLPVAAVAATAVYRRVNDGLSWSDLQSECFAWAAAHPRKVGEYLGHEDESQGVKLLSRSMQNHCMRATQRERAAKRGYKHYDVAWYSVEQIREDLLPALWDREAWTSPPVKDRNEGGGGSLPNERGGWMTLLADVADAYSRLPRELKQLLLMKYGFDMTNAEVETHEGLTEDEVKKGLQRAVQAIHHRLGGERPQACEPGCECKVGPEVAPRHSRNGQALAEMERTYQGE